MSFGANYRLPVTVVIPAYNRADLLPRALRSIATQVRFRPSEVIVVDDASDDDTAAVARAAGVRVLHHRVNRGPSAARNTGFAAAQTPWLMQLDSDDEWLPYCLATLWPLRHGHVLVSGASIGGQEKPWYNGVPASGPRVVTAPELVFPDNFVASSAVLLDAACVRKAGGYRTDIRYAEDLELWLRMLEHGTAIVTPVPVSRYHGHARQATAVPGEAHAGHTRILALSVDRAWWQHSLVVRWSAIQVWDALRLSVHQGDVRGFVLNLSRLIRRPGRLCGLLIVLRHRAAGRRALKGAVTDPSSVSAVARGSQIAASTRPLAGAQRACAPRSREGLAGELESGKATTLVKRLFGARQR